MRYTDSYEATGASFAGDYPAQAEQGWHANNFKLLRMVTAVTVAATHCLWIVYGFNPSNEWPLGVLIQASHCGICIFFGLSGYLIASSLTERPNFFRFTISRIARLCPLLFFAAVLISFVAGPIFTMASFADYYSDWRLWSYVPMTTMAFSDMTLPGLFEAAPAGGEVNVSIWTLKYEIIAYVGVGLLAAVGMMHHRFVWLWSALAIAAYVYISYFTQLRSEIDFLQHGLRFGFAFLMGVLLYTYRPILHINLIGVFVVIGVAINTNSTAYMEPFRIIALTYTAIWFGSQKAGLLNFYNRFGDYSYGIFVFHWPIAQLILQSNPAISYVDLLTYVMPLTIACAVFSWHFVEAPILASRFAMADAVSNRFLSLVRFGSVAGETVNSQVRRPFYQWGKRGFQIMTSYPAPTSNPQTPTQVQAQFELQTQNIEQSNRHRYSYMSAKSASPVPQPKNEKLRYPNKQLAQPIDPNVPACFRPQATGYQRR